MPTLRRLFDVRPGERRETTLAFVVLFGMLAAHTILETARDALFLSRLPPSQLPWVYLAMAGTALAVWRAFPSRWSTGPNALPVLLLLCAVGTAIFWACRSLTSPWALRALYVWTGLVSTLAAVQFWVLVGEMFTITQAKRVYSIIGLGSLLGAVAGGTLARLLSARAAASDLLLASAAIMALTCVPAVLLRGPRAAAPSPSREPRVREGLRQIRGQPYLLRLAALGLVSTVAVTLADYVFKSAVARAIGPGQLASFFASVHITVNVLALTVQLVAVGWLLRVHGLHRSMGALPALLFLGSLSVAFGGGLVAAVFLKGADGAIRPSLQRTSTELLFLPVPDRIRARARPLVDVLGQRGGQAVASVLILGAIGGGAGQLAIAAAAAGLCALWWVRIADLQPHYVEMFRKAVREGTLKESAGLPDLDLAALEVLITALGSGDDAEVEGALDLLAEEGRVHLIPGMILFHPSRAVVFHALALFADSGRREFVPSIERLLSSPDAEIRAAALRARIGLEPDPVLLRTAAEDESPLVRATALVGLVAGGSHSPNAEDLLGELARSSHETQRALARAIERQPAAALEDLVLQLSESTDPEVLRHAVHAMGKIRTSRFRPRLIQLLGQQDFRVEARAALLDHGEEALRFLDEALGDGGLPLRIRRQVPRTISLFPPRQAAPILVRRLLRERDGMTRFRILRGLGRIRTDHPDTPLDTGVLRDALEQTVDTALQLLRWRVSLVRSGAEDPRRATTGHEMLVTLLRDKETHAVERAFRLVACIVGGEDLRSIHRGLRNTNPKVRASSRELLEHVLPGPVRGRILALVDDAFDEERAAQIEPALAARVPYDELLATLADSGSESLRALAQYHADELAYAG